MVSLVVFLPADVDPDLLAGVQLGVADATVVLEGVGHSKTENGKELTN